MSFSVFYLTRYSIPLTKRLKSRLFRLARSLPPVRAYIEKEKTTIQAGMQKEFLDPCKDVEDMVTLPKKGLTRYGNR